MTIKRDGKYITGTCAIGCHEGSNPKNYKGQSLPTCTSWEICNCHCHVEFDELFAIGNRPRELVNNSSYMPEAQTFVMPDPVELAATRASGNVHPTDTPVVLKSELPDVIPATIDRSWIETPSGRAARGELEAQVKWACDVWVVEYGLAYAMAQARPCSPKYISEEIARKYGIKAPSVGAIDAVYQRWEKIGFAVIARKPTRFLRYTEDGIKLTLEGCKDRAKRQKVKNS